MSEKEKKGYLNEDFQIFHLTDENLSEFEYHYHDFDKIVILLRGDVSYTIEGKTYDLIPYDCILVPHYEIHRPAIRKNTIYERIIIYISPSFLESFSSPGEHLNHCFIQAKEAQTNVLRIPSLKNSRLFHVIQDLVASFQKDAFANKLYQQVLFLEFMIYLNRAVLEHTLIYLDTNTFHPKILEILQYINENITGELNIDKIADSFFVSKYYMMRLFKSETGYTIGNYITHKRLLLAKDMLRNGNSVTESCFFCGFHDYSTFLRAYRKLFGSSPKEDLKK